MEEKNINQVVERIRSAIDNHDYHNTELGIRDILEYLTIHMMKNKNDSDRTLIAVMLIKFDKVIDYNLESPCATNISKGRLNLYINPIWFIEFKPIEMEAILEHEVYHILNNHIQRANILNPKNDKELYLNLNIAMDVAINQYIKNLPKSVITLHYFLYNICYLDEAYEPEYRYRDKPFEFYYEMLNKKKKEIGNKTKNELDEKSNEISKANKDYGNNKDNSTKITSGKFLDDHKKWNDVNNLEQAKLTDIVKDFIEDAIKTAKNFNPQFDRGRLSSNLSSMIDNLNKPPIIKWQNKLKEAVASFSCPYKTTILRRSRRCPDRYDVKGRMNDRNLKITIAIDTSGSISDEKLQYFFNEVFNIIELTKFKLTVIQCDSEIKDIKTYNNKRQFDLKDIKIHGRGGTAFSPVFEYINTLHSDNYPDVLLYFTDGWGERELSIKKLKSPLYLIWILDNEKNKLSVNNPMTNKVLYLNINE